MTAALARAPVESAARRLCVVLHDVAPARWGACRRVLDQIEQVAAHERIAVPVTLLVVPHLHGRSDTPPPYLRWLQRLAGSGHELALHGLTHLDPGQADSLAGRLLRRCYTAGEGEFAALPQGEAQRRLAQARRWAWRHELPMRGFVPPAWLMDDAARDAVTRAGFDYTCTLTQLVALPGGEVLRGLGLTFSTRSAWRRAGSVAWNTLLARAQRELPVLRLELHPADADHDGVRRCWTRVLAQALHERTPARLADAADLVRGGSRLVAAPPLPGAAPAPAALAAPQHIRTLHGSHGTALVAGAAGFVGSHLCDRLLHAGWHVVGLDDLSTGSAEHLAHLRDDPRFGFVAHDVTEPLPGEAQRADRIFNLACPASPAYYLRHPVRTMLASTQGTWRLLELAAARRIRLLHVSTSEVYGDPQVHPQHESYRGHVNPIGPRSCYDEGKRCAEALCFAYTRERGSDVRIARLFNCYGPRLRAGDGRVVSNFIVQALAGRPLTVYGDGSQTRSFCFVDDTVRGLLLLADASLRLPVNLGNPQEFTVLELAQRVLQLTGSRSEISFRPLPADDPARRRPDIDTAQRLLDWQPQVALDEGLLRTIAYFRQLGYMPAESTP